MDKKIEILNNHLCDYSDESGEYYRGDAVLQIMDDVAKLYKKVIRKVLKDLNTTDGVGLDDINRNLKTILNA